MLSIDSRMLGMISRFVCCWLNVMVVISVRFGYR